MLAAAVGVVVGLALVMQAARSGAWQTIPGYKPGTGVQT